MTSYNYISSSNKKKKNFLPKYPNRTKRSKRSHFPLILLLIFISFSVLIIFFLPRLSFSSQHPENSVLEESPWQTKEGQLFFKTDKPGVYKKALQMETDVKITVSGLIAKARVLQHFENTEENWVEGLYAFPLPEDAAVTHLRMHIGERVIEGQIQEKKQAKKTYEKAKKEGKKASLLEQKRPNIFTILVANIAPHEKITIELEYQHIALYDNGTFSIRFPTVIGPRYIPGNKIDQKVTTNQRGWAFDTDQVPDASEITPPVVKPGEPLVNPTSIFVSLDPGFPLADLKSLYHSVDIDEKTDGSQQVSLTHKKAIPDRDFVLEWTPEKNRTPKAAVFSEKMGNDIYTLLMVMPPHEDAIHDYPVPREIIFIVDISGSMSGSSITQAKEALKLAISRLKPKDSFNIITFNDNADRMFSSARSAKDREKRIALKYVNNLEATGGTEMMSALNMALDGQKHPRKIRQVVFLTDGCVGNEEALFQVIQEKLGDSRLFTIGIGSAPNSFFMRNAAQQGRGSFIYIGKVEEVQMQMGQLFTKLETPALTDIELLTDSQDKTESYPFPVPDLYFGEPVIFITKTDSLPKDMILTGILGGKRWNTSLNPFPSVTQKGISTLWARSKIKSLMASIRLGADKEQVREKVLESALKHHLVSKYTSLVAVDVTPVRPVDESIHGRSAKSNLPKGWKYDKVFKVPQTGTVANFCFVLGALTIMLSGMLWLLIRRYPAK